MANLGFGVRVSVELIGEATTLNMNPSAIRAVPGSQASASDPTHTRKL